MPTRAQTRLESYGPLQHKTKKQIDKELTNAENRRKQLQKMKGQKLEKFRNKGNARRAMTYVLLEKYSIMEKEKENNAASAASTKRQKELMKKSAIAALENRKVRLHRLTKLFKEEEEKEQLKEKIEKTTMEATQRHDYSVEEKQEKARKANEYAKWVNTTSKLKDTLSTQMKQNEIEKNMAESEMRRQELLKEKQEKAHEHIQNVEMTQKIKTKNVVTERKE